MATLFTHPAIALGLFPWFRQFRYFKPVLVIGILLTILPDIDVIGFRFDISYAHLFGHRGFTHSLFFAGFVSAVSAWVLAKYYALKLAPVWLFLFLCLASHGLLDALTNGGHGVAFFSPFSNQRYFFSVQPIEVSTLSISRFFAGQGIKVISSELVWVWLPAMGIFLAGLVWLRLANSKSKADVLR